MSAVVDDSLYPDTELVSADTLDAFAAAARDYDLPSFSHQPGNRVDLYIWVCALHRLLHLLQTRDASVPVGNALWGAFKPWDNALLMDMHTARTNIAACEMRGTSVLWLGWLARCELLRAWRGADAVVGLGADTVRWMAAQGILSLRAGVDTVSHATLSKKKSVLEVAMGALEERVGGHLVYTREWPPDACARHLRHLVLYLEAAVYEHLLDILHAAEEKDSTNPYPPALEMRFPQRAAAVFAWVRRSVLVYERVAAPLSAPHEQAIPPAAKALGRSLEAWAEKRLSPLSNEMGDTFWTAYMWFAAQWTSRPGDGITYAQKMMVADGSTGGAKHNEVWQEARTALEMRYWIRDARSDKRDVPTGNTDHAEDAALRVMLAARNVGVRDGRRWLRREEPYGTAMLLAMFHMLCESNARAMFPWKTHCLIKARDFFAMADATMHMRRTPLVVLMQWWQPVVYYFPWDEDDTRAWDASEGGRVPPFEAVRNAIGMWLHIAHTMCDDAIAVYDSADDTYKGTNMRSVFDSLAPQTTAHYPPSPPPPQNTRPPPRASRFRAA